jgi:hypothetical protein
MDTGMLWFDDSAKPLAEKVQRAAAYYAEKYGRAPTMCLVNPAGLNGGERTAGEVQIRPARSVMPHHLWMGVDEERGNGRGSRADAPEAKAGKRPRRAAKSPAKTTKQQGRKKAA